MAGKLRYRAEVDEDGTAVPPRTRNLKPLERSQSNVVAGSPSLDDRPPSRGRSSPPRSALKSKEASLPGIASRCSVDDEATTPRCEPLPLKSAIKSSSAVPASEGNPEVVEAAVARAAKSALKASAVVKTPVATAEPAEDRPEPRPTKSAIKSSSAASSTASATEVAQEPRPTKGALKSRTVAVLPDEEAPIQAPIEPRLPKSVLKRAQSAPSSVAQADEVDPPQRPKCVVKSQPPHAAAAEEVAPVLPPVPRPLKSGLKSKPAAVASTNSSVMEATTASSPTESRPAPKSALKSKSTTGSLASTEEASPRSEVQLGTPSSSSKSPARSALKRHAPTEDFATAQPCDASTPSCASSAGLKDGAEVAGAPLARPAKPALKGCVRSGPVVAVVASEATPQQCSGSSSIGTEEAGLKEIPEAGKAVDSSGAAPSQAKRSVKVSVVVPEPCAEEPRKVPQLQSEGEEERPAKARVRVSISDEEQPTKAGSERPSVNEPPKPVLRKAATDENSAPVARTVSLASAASDADSEEWDSQWDGDDEGDSQFRQTGRTSSKDSQDMGTKESLSELWKAGRERALSFVNRPEMSEDIGAGAGRRVSHKVTLNSKLLEAAEACDRRSLSKMKRSQSIIICIDPEDGEQDLLSKIEDPETVSEAGGTGADGDCTPQPDAASADTGGTPPEHRENPLKELITAKKVDIAQLRNMLETLPDVERWINSPLSVMPPVVPAPLFFAIGATLPTVVGLLLEFSADVQRPYSGDKMYNGWIKPAATAIEAVTNRRGRFMGTMLGDRLEEILELLNVAKARKEASEAEVGVGKVESFKEIMEEKVETLIQKETRRDSFHHKKSIKLVAAIGTIEHTQGHPDEKYSVLSDIGEGVFCKVVMAANRKTNERRAIKAEMKVEEGCIWEEIAVMRKLYHPNVIQLIETFEDESNIFEVLELCEGGELFDRLAAEGGVPERHAARFMQQLASAVSYLHEQSICHRSIQPENFLLKENLPLSQANLKLIDFATAKEFGPNNPLKTKICTLHYVAPEILTRKENIYTEKVDVWSLGVVFFVTLCGSPPFDGENEVAILKKIKKGTFKFHPPEIWSRISNDAKDLVQKMLVVDVDSRLSAEDVTRHAWLVSDFKASRASKAQNHLSVEQLNNLRNFHARNRVMKAVQRLRAQKLSGEAISEVRAIFDRLEKDAAGEASIAAFRETVQQTPLLAENMEEISRVLWSLEQQASSMSIENFMGAIASRHEVVQKEACRAIFDVFDFDGSGTISIAEVQQALSFGNDSDPFKAGVEAVFGMPASEIEGRIRALQSESQEYTLEDFASVMLSSSR